MSSLSSFAAVAKSDALNRPAPFNIIKKVKGYCYDHFIGVDGKITIRPNGGMEHRFYVISQKRYALQSPIITNLGKPTFSCHTETKPGVIKWVISVPSDPIRGELIASGALNLAMGVVGSIGVILTAPESGGASAVIGLPLTFGEATIGGAQLADALSNKNPNKKSILHKSSSIPGLIAYSQGFEHAGLVDAMGQFLPGTISPAAPIKLFGFRNYSFFIRERNIAGGIESLRQVVPLYRSGRKIKSAFELASAYDAYGDVTGLGDAAWETIWQSLDQAQAGEQSHNGEHTDDDHDKADKLKDYMKSLPTQPK